MARKSGRNAEELMRLYTLEGLLARLSISQYSVPASGGPRSPERSAIVDGKSEHKGRFTAVYRRREGWFPDLTHNHGRVGPTGAVPSTGSGLAARTSEENWGSC